jgi:hypothetical protein
LIDQYFPAGIVRKKLPALSTFGGALSWTGRVLKFKKTVDCAPIDPENLSGSRFVPLGFGEYELDVATIELRKSRAIVDQARRCKCTRG